MKDMQKIIFHKVTFYFCIFGRMRGGGVAIRFIGLDEEHDEFASGKIPCDSRYILTGRKG